MENSVHSDTTFCQSHDVISTNLDGEAVIMSIENGNYYGLDHVGNDIWQLLAEPRSFQDIYCHMMDKYSVERSRCEEDIKEFLQQIANEKLVTIS